MPLNVWLVESQYRNGSDRVVHLPQCATARMKPRWCAPRRGPWPPAGPRPPPRPSAPDARTARPQPEA